MELLQIERLMESLISPSEHSICEIFHRVLAATVPPLYIMVCAVLLRALDVSKGKNNRVTQNAPNVKNLQG